MRSSVTTGKQGFTLIELLSVLAIMGLMLGMLLPALSGFQSTYERKQAVGTVMNTLEQARVAALQSGGNVHVIFARPNDSASAADAMIVVGEPPFGSANTNKVLHTRWIKMPEGVRFRGSANTLSLGALPAGITTNMLPPIGAASYFSGITFNSTGQIEYPASGNLLLALFQGLRVGGSESAAGGAAKATQGLSDSGLYEVIRVSRYTGRSRMDVATLEQK